jgi:hypothetical protein
VAHLAAAEARFYWLFIKLETDGGSALAVSLKARGLACSWAHNRRVIRMWQHLLAMAPGTGPLRSPCVEKKWSSIESGWA